jgi:Family of unknown function (DUF5683)
VSLFLTLSLQAQDLQKDNASEDTSFVMQKSPWGAVLRSAIIPGFGQFYNESYWKIPVIWGIGAWFAYGWIHNNDLYTQYGDLYRETQNSFYRLNRNFYRDQRDNFAIYIGLLYLLNLVDAYVDAHLFDFTVDENLIGGGTRLNVRINF